MPIYEIRCADCGHVGEVLTMVRLSDLACPSCGSEKTSRLMSATSSLTGRSGQNLPGPQDTGCCGRRPGQAEGCAGPGSCCGQG